MGCWNNPNHSVTKATKHFNRKRDYLVHNSQIQPFGMQSSYSKFLLHLLLFNNFSVFSSIFLNAISIHHDRLRGQAQDLNVLITFKNLLLCRCCICILFFPLFLFCQYISRSKWSFHQNCSHPLYPQNLIIMENMPSSIFNQHCSKRLCALVYPLLL